MNSIELKASRILDRAAKRHRNKRMMPDELKGCALAFGIMFAVSQVIIAIGSAWIG